MACPSVGNSPPGRVTVTRLPPAWHSLVQCRFSAEPALPGVTTPSPRSPNSINSRAKQGKASGRGRRRMCDPEPQAGMEAGAFKICDKPAAQTNVYKYRIWDVAQKSLYLRNNQLVAGYLQGPNSALEEKISWVPNRSFEREKFPIILGIQDGRRSLACGTGGQPALQLEDVNITELSRGGEEAARFTFFRSYKEGMWRFESATNPGWLLCTSAQSNEPLGLARGPDAAHIVDFYFQLC
ncbi:interleukin-36 receptor antagonist protein-like [Emydura macquarii macquarii]|uniref:interleukin-36 receptor antagonist protein-like n=1 Tax=Emydura macquarii macquarii TaxID=1129001 RepID=UPI00352A9300